VEGFVEIAAQIGPHRGGVVVGAALVFVVGKVRRRSFRKLRRGRRLYRGRLGRLRAALAAVQEVQVAQDSHDLPSVASPAVETGAHRYRLPPTPEDRAGCCTPAKSSL